MYRAHISHSDPILKNLYGVEWLRSQTLKLLHTNFIYSHDKTCKLNILTERSEASWLLVRVGSASRLHPTGIRHSPGIKELMSESDTISLGSDSWGLRPRSCSRQIVSESDAGFLSGVRVNPGYIMMKLLSSLKRDRMLESCRSAIFPLHH